MLAKLVKLENAVAIHKTDAPRVQKVPLVKMALTDLLAKMVTMVQLVWLETIHQSI